MRRRFFAKSHPESDDDHRLNILAALFFPLMAVAGLFGMNLAHGLGENAPPIFWLVVVASCALGFGIKRWVLRQPNSGKPSVRSDATSAHQN